MLRKKIYSRIVITIVLIFLVLIALTCYLLFTTKGSSFVIKSALSKYSESKDIAVKKTEGNLSENLVLQDIELRDLEWLPQGSIIKLQHLSVYFASFSFTGLRLELSNGRLILPESEVILFYGDYRDNSFDLNIFSNRINVRHFLDLFMEGEVLRYLSGLINQLDILAKGPFLEPELTGSLQIEGLAYKDFLLHNCPVSFNIVFKDIKNTPQVYGEISFKSGRLAGPKTAVVELQESRVLFSGDPGKPRLDFKGTSTIEGIKIGLALTGTMEKPDLKLLSEPPLPQEQLLVMLATGKRWKGAAVSFTSRQLSPDLVADFIDYFVFGGAGSRMAKQLGITEISLKLNQQTKGIGLKKEITDKTGVSYSVEQKQTTKDDTSLTQKVGGEYKVTDSISLEAERELKQDNTTEKTQDELETEDKVMLKFKKRF